MLLLLGCGARESSAATAAVDDDNLLRWCELQKPHLEDIISWMPLPLKILSDGSGGSILTVDGWMRVVAGFNPRPTRTCRHGAFAGGGGVAFI